MTQGRDDRSGAPDRPSSSSQRQRVIEALCEHYAQDHLGMAEFERRLDTANRVRGAAELDELLADLPQLESGPSGRRDPGERRAEGRALSVPAGAGQIDARRVPDHQTEFAILSGRARSGSWVPARNIRVMAFMGGVELDFREALFGPGDVRIHCGAIFGGIEIIVPPGIHVHASGFAIFGGFDEALSGGGEIPPDAPTIRISGAAFMGAVEIHTRLPGESSRQARRRIRAAEKKRLEEARDERE